MSYTVPLTTPANARSTDYGSGALYGEFSGGNIRNYTADDLFAASIPAAIGTNLLEGPVALENRFLNIHAKGDDTLKIRVATGRSHDVAPKWSSMNPSAGVFVDAGLSAWLQATKAQGAETVYTLFHTPTWASARPSEVGSPYGILGALAEPASMTTLSNFVTWLMTNYGDQIDYIEIWNEPKYSLAAGSFFSGTPTILAQMAKTINQAAKAVNPTVKLIGVGATGLLNGDGSQGAGIGWTSSFLAASDGAAGTGADWIDILSVHTYIHDGTNRIKAMESLKPYLDTIKAASGISAMPVWSSEFGYITPGFSTYTGPIKARINLLIRYAMYHVVAGISRAFMYAYTSLGWGGDSAGDAEWNRWVGILNGATVTRINRVGAEGQLACVINGVNYLI